ncbi:MAG: OadG family protein [Firmicutes bacterium]|nr:OadG family protein [Bacillota bacterium]
MNNLAVGIELLFTGMFTTFLVLVFLMYQMKVTSALIAKRSAPEEKSASPTKAEPALTAPRTTTVAAGPSAGLAADELVAIMAALGKVLPANQKAVVRITPPSTSGVAEEEMVAAVVGALAARS